MIITLDEAVGTTPSHQLVAVFQSVLTKPVHEPAIHVADVIFNVPDAGAKYEELINVAAEPVPPQEPADCPLPAIESVFAEWVNPVPRLTTMPLAIEKFPLVIVLFAKVLVPLPASVRLLNVVAPLIDWVVPFRLIVLVPCVKVPVFDQLPAILWVNVLAENEVPVPIVKLPPTVIASTAVVVAVPAVAKLF